MIERDPDVDKIGTIDDEFIIELFFVPFSATLLVETPLIEFIFLCIPSIVFSLGNAWDMVDAD